jgi:hypothetical protein
MKEQNVIHCLNSWSTFRSPGNHEGPLGDEIMPAVKALALQSANPLDPM